MVGRRFPRRFVLKPSRPSPLPWRWLAPFQQAGTQCVEGKIYMSKIFWSKAMYNTIVYEKPREKVARVSLNRPESRNAQDTTLLHELNDAFDKAAHDDTVSVIILAANGPHFSSGHDLREPDLMKKLNDFRPVGTWSNFGAPGAEGWMAREKELYLGFSERWRNIPKPTIAAVQ